MSPLSRLYKYAARHRPTIILGCVYSILNKLFDLAPPVLIGAAVDLVVQKEASFIARMGFTEPRDQLIFLAVATIVIWGAESIFEYLYQTTWRNLAQTIQHELRLSAYTHIQDLEMAWFQEQKSGELLAILNEDVNQLERFLDGGANQLLQVATTVVAVGAMFFGISFPIAVLAIAPMPLVIYGGFKFQSTLTPRYAKVREKAGTLSGTLSNNLSGIETIKSFTAETLEVARIQRQSQDYLEANKGAIRLSSAFSPLIRMVIVVGFTTTLVYGGWMALDGTLEVGAYSVLVFLTQRLLWPLTRLGETFDLYQRAMASTRRILDLLDTPISVEDGSEELDQVQGEVVFEDIAFHYPGRDPLLTNFDLRIPAGKTVAIVGATGSGKSTLIRLLLRFHDPQSGRILVDGRDIQTLTMRSLRSAVGLVSQRVFLFPGTVRENVCYGHSDVSEEALIHAGDVAEASGFIAELPQGWDTEIGERGQKLSGGQQQRLSIARAVLKDPPVLVLDEATSAVDNETEAAIQRSLETISKGRTTIVIAHRLSTIRHADEILVIDGGTLAERGSHEALVASGGLYARLWAVQTGDDSASTAAK